jgi:hypothetical protein
MSQVFFEFRFESDGVTSNQDVGNAKKMLKQWIEKKLFQASVNNGLQVEEDLNIQLITCDDDTASFEVVDGWAEPSLRHNG